MGSIGMVIMVILIIEDEDEDKAEGGRPQHAAIALRKSIKWAKNILRTQIVDRLTLGATECCLLFVPCGSTDEDVPERW